MNHKLPTLLFLSVFLLSFASPSSAIPPQVEKLKRGACNMILGGVEVPKYMIIEAANAEKPRWASLRGVFYGSFKGAIKGTKRILSGAYDVLTFPINYPDHYSSLVSPDYFTFSDID